MAAELNRVETNLKLNIESQAKYAKKVDVETTLKRIEKEIWYELKLKMEKTTVQSKFESMEEELDALSKKNNKEIGQIRELVQQMNKKNLENTRHLAEIDKELDIKMNKNEGVAIYKALKEYCKYSELKELYNKVNPAIARFETRLLEFHTEKLKTDEVLKRFDEVLCEKADKILFKEMRSDVDRDYASKVEQVKAVDLIESSIKTFTVRIQELDELVKFQSRQI